MVNCEKILNTIFTEGRGHLVKNNITRQLKITITEKWVYDMIQSQHPNYILQQPIVGFKYVVGDFLHWHTDDMYGKGMDMTGGIVLNDDYEGGIFEFEDETTLDQTPGKAFEMRRDVSHRVTEITKGTRYSLHYRLHKEKKLI
jgi:hypothetical protein